MAAREVLKITDEAPTAAEPAEGALDDPALGSDPESLGGVGSLDDLQRHPGLGLDISRRCRPLIATVGDAMSKTGKPLARDLQQRRDHVTILHVGRRDCKIDDQPRRIDGGVALLAFDFLARIVTGRIDTRPPFSALFTLWLSTMAMVGSSARPSSCRASAWSAW